jgi:amino acid adenylation domain-containing protein
MQGQRRPAAVAVRAAGESLTYSELNARANRLARRLRALGVGPEVLVGVCASRSTAMVVGLLAILKAGGAYVPLDPNYPADRLAFMLGDARVSVVLTQENLLERLPDAPAPVICLDRELEAVASEPDDDLPAGATLDNLAYVIYTSGSTGRPKGAMIHHRGLANYLAWCVRAYRLPEGAGAPVHSSISFDLTITSLLAPLVAGGRVDLLEESLGIEQLSEALRRARNYSLVKITPAHLRWLGDQLDPRHASGATRAFVIGGEALKPEHVEFWRRNAPDTTLFNEYGPTETVVGCCVYRVPRDQSLSSPIPIGRPIASMRLYVTDERLEPVPMGVAGELYIGGPGLARGYLRRPGLTAGRFIPDPFCEEPGGRLYRTGDRVLWRSDGNFVYLGRVDRQVKIRGFRIEPAEIEEAILRHDALREAVVVDREGIAGDRRLIAYLTIVAGRTAPADSDLRRFLRTLVPEPMIPAEFVVLLNLPLSANGKVDHAALPAPGASRAATDAAWVRPRGSLEKEVASAWEKVLGREEIGAHDNFFDLGGHSLLATQVVSRLRDALGVDIPLRAIFEAPTVARFAERINAGCSGGSKRARMSIEPTARVGPVPLSFSQEALWFLDQLAPGQPTFNVHAAVRIKGPLDRVALERSVSALVRRHESLRTTFVAKGGIPHQVVAPELSLCVETSDLTALAATDRELEARRRAIDESRRPFDLAGGPLIRVSLLRLGPAEHVALLTMHHLITDGWSFGLAAAELAALYQADRKGLPSPLADPPIQYADFSRWQREQFASGGWAASIEFWKGRLADLPPLELPVDHARPPIRSPHGAMLPLVLSPELSDLVRSFSRRQGVTPFMTLLAAFELLLGRWSGQDDFAVGSPMANRTRVETQHVIGYFINMVALRADLAGNPTVHEMLCRVRETCLESFEHQEIPLEVLIPALGQGRDASRSPLFQVMFVLQNNPVPSFDHLEFELSLFDTDHGTGTAKFDLALGFGEARDGFVGSLEFNTDLFETATIERFARHYVKLLEELVASPQRRLSELSLLSEVERHEVTAWSDARPAAVQGTMPNPEPPDRGIHGRFEAQVRATPDAVALISGDRSSTLTYAGLNARANQLAHYLRSWGVRPEVRVGLLLDDPINRIVAVIGVLKAGGAYVPLDPSLPEARLQEMMALADVRILAVERGLRTRGLGSSTTTIDVVAEGRAIAARSCEDHGVHTEADQLAYVVFTSGSTGRPKGVLVPHRGLLAVAAAWEEAYDLRHPPLRHLQAAGFGFDVFAGDWIRALSTGGTLVMCRREVALDPAALAEVIRNQRIQCVEVVPALAEHLAWHLEMIGGNLVGLRLLAVGSDTLRAELYRRLRRLVGPAGRVVNSYGLTEATIDSAFFEGPLDSGRGDGLVPIGHPMPGTRARILDERGEPVPAGIVGELYIGGSGVARGYAALPRQTAGRFVPDAQGPPGSRIYATGDRARWRRDGVIELLGRRDRQVKIRGYRVELAEVEAAIGACPGVREVGVIARKDASHGEALIALVVGKERQTPRADAIRRFLRDKLPRPMIPSHIRIVDRLARTSSGKVDRRSLADSLSEEISTGEGLIPPRDAIEEQLAAIWEDLLQVKAVSVNDDFFDLGGHSLLAVRLAARIEERFARTIALSDLLLGATIEELAVRLRMPEERTESSLLIELRSAGAGPPLVLVHPIGGGVLCYGALVRSLDGVGPVLGIQASGVEDDAEPETDVEQMASRYVNLVRARFPEGPYFLGGWSMGGVVAFEMARQLTEAGQEVRLLFLIDCAVPRPRRAFGPVEDEESVLAFATDLARTAGRDARAELKRLRRLDPKAKQNGTIDPAILGRELSAEIGPLRFRRLHGVFRANRSALDSYTPRPYRGRVALIESESGRSWFEQAPREGWRALALGGLTAYQVTGDHYTILQQPSVERIAEFLAREIHQPQPTS